MTKKDSVLDSVVLVKMAPVDVKNQHGVQLGIQRVRRTRYRYVAKPKQRNRSCSISLSQLLFRGCRKNNGPPFHHTLESHYACHTMAPADRKERSRVGGGAGARCTVLCQCSRQVELDPRLVGKVIIMPENVRLTVGERGDPNGIT